MELQLTQKEADELIDIAKKIMSSHSNILRKDPATKGRIEIRSKQTTREFLFTYFYGVDKIQMQLMDWGTKHVLVRVNLDENFHKNSDNTYARGNRINIFNEKEFYDKGDGTTHYTAHELPFKTIRNTEDFFEILEDLFDFTNVEEENKVNISISETLNIEE